MRSTLSAPALGGFDAHGGRDPFEHLRRFREPSTGRVSVKILPGEYYASPQDEVITTVLGSCVAACIHDPTAGVGGMNHFMLPEPAANGGRWGGTAVGRSARYGGDAMEQLVNAVLKAGGIRERLRVKIFGGGCVLAWMTDIGRRNIEFVHRYLDAESLQLEAEDVGGAHPRQVRYYPRTGRTQVRRLRNSVDAGLAALEQQYLKQLAADPIKGEVEIF